MRAALRCAILDDYQQVALSCADWSALDGRADITVFTEPFRGPEETVAALADLDAVVAMRERTPFPAPVLARLPRLRLLVTTGMRNASIDLPAAQRHGVVVCGTASLTTAPVGRAFGMDVIAWSQNLTAQQCVENGVRLAPSLSALLGEADFASVHLVLSPRSGGVIVDQGALIDALRHGQIAGAGLDVFELEPLPAQHPYRTLPTVLATPHIGYVTRGNYALYFRDVVDDIAAFVDGLPVRVLEP